ncbi:MAG: DUF2851 family protein [Verrucomicrobia bacterium]|nr:DUF2851 family protein [Verrucomicrobiota bacterium]
MGITYRQWVRENILREEPLPILSESVLQRIWFESLVRNPFTTLHGETILLNHPGFWNHRAGPDFLRASFTATGGSLQEGDVEIHRHSSDWHAHRHSGNPLYEKVVLHVFWQFDPTAPPAPSSIRQIALADQLAAPLTELISLFQSSSWEMSAGERPGRCRQTLLSLPPEKLREILEEAGWHRLRQRRSLAQARVAAHGFQQAVWIALAEGLGFSENREPFASLARAAPIQTLLDLPDPVRREAILYGVAGLLPDPTRIPCSPRAQGWVQNLWNKWWEYREAWRDRTLPPSCWKMGSTRPNNSPLRRLAALSFMTRPDIWRSWLGTVQSGNAKAFLDQLKAVHHPFWDQHSAWDGRILSAPSRLVGWDRATALLFQVLAPLADVSEKDLMQRMVSWPIGGSAGMLRSACLRLLGVPFPLPDIRSHLAREGLLQIYKDFCRREADSCRNCSMPEVLKHR